MSSGPFELAEAALAVSMSAWSRVGTQDLARPTPCAEFSVAALAEHVVGAMVLLGASAGGTVTDPGGGDPAQRISAVTTQALAAWRARGLDGTAAVGSRTIAAELAHTIVLLELVVHGWDVTRALGEQLTDVDVPAQLTAYLAERAPALIRPDRRGRAFADPVEVGANAAPLEHLIAFTGRRP